MTKRGYLILFIAITILTVGAVFLFFNSKKNLEVVFFDVGQGDAAFIKTPWGQNIIIDGGPDNSVLKGLGSNLPWYDRDIDLMILTHPHDDHVAGLVDVLKRYKVSKVLYTGVEHNAPNYIKWLEVIKEKNISLIISDKKQKINLGNNCYLEIIYPDRSFLNKDVDNLNNSSIVVRLVYNKNSFLFTGDIEKEVEGELIDKNIDLKADVLKVAHHSSDTSSTEDFLRIVDPEIAVISLAEDNNFGFPSRRVLLRLEKEEVEILRTDLRGNIKFVSDGENIKFDN